jgi:hypothetical protein
MKEALLHLDNAINVLRRSAGVHAAIISTLEGPRVQSLFGQLVSVSALFRQRGSLALACPACNGIDRAARNPPLQAAALRRPAM